MLDRFEVEGGIPLRGKIAISGSKNATLPLMAAALLADGNTVIENAPDLQDIRTMAMVLKVLGADVRFQDHRLIIDSKAVRDVEAPYELVRKMRASFYVLGPLLARFGKARVSLPGGCALGPRPVDLHLKALQKLGCEITIDAGYVIAKAERMTGARVSFDIASVGATGNLLMAAVAAHGTTIIENAACEPEITDLADMLNAMGANISGAGSKHIEVVGPTPLKPVTWKVIPDRIETGTFLIAVAATKGKATLEECRPDHLMIVLEKLLDAGVTSETTQNTISIDATSTKLKAVDLTTQVYPGFPTDLQAPWTSLMCLADGDSSISDTIYPERFSHIPELVRLGAIIRKELNSIHVRGVSTLAGASVMCSDIRAGAGLVIATLAAKGYSDLLRVYHLDRGYEKIEEKVSRLGGKVRRLRE
jgi:UDP-N-acetylglucosamine 1-carboxyvinyltransferase